jgi:hypothetical protein
MVDDTKKGIEKLFRDALRSLAIEPEEQVRVTEPGDVPVELIEDYLTWSGSFVNHFKSELGADTASAIMELREAVDGLPETVFRETNLSPMQQPEWQPIREHAKRILELLGWPCVSPEPFTSEDQSVYRRP